MCTATDLAYEAEAAKRLLRGLLGAASCAEQVLHPKASLRKRELIMAMHRQAHHMTGTWDPSTTQTLGVRGRAEDLHTTPHHTGQRTSTATEFPDEGSDGAALKESESSTCAVVQCSRGLTPEATTTL